MQNTTPKKVLILTTVSGFLQKFETRNVRILQEAGYEVHYAANPELPVYTDRDGIKAPDDTAGLLYSQAEVPHGRAEADGMHAAHHFRIEAGVQIPQGVIFHPLPIDKSPYHLIRNTQVLRQLTALIRAEGIDVIHCHTPVGGLLGRLAGHRCGCRVIYTAHGFHFYKGAPVRANLLYGTVERWLARYTDVLIVINEEDYAAAQHFPLKPGGKVYRIPGVGLELAAFPPVSETERRIARERLALGENDLFLLSVGELNANKNHRIVLQALALLQKQREAAKYPVAAHAAGQDTHADETMDGRQPAADLTLSDVQGEYPARIRYGICGEGPGRDALERQIHALGLESHAVLYGYVSPIRQMLAAADIFLFPSRREGLGMAALEAMAAGLPVIAADNRGTREYMDPGVNGFSCAWDDAAGWAEAIRHVCGMSAKAQSAMRKEAVRTAERFSAEHTSAVMRRVYLKLTGE